ncbi:hypothetical protein BRD17_09975 [Halobacteriales archaeon SW_7_68_16]|nr:MAG: hypothetical protein BRD17_09975 [Halobacteriales archaeon SW_7_68_16]
MGRYHLRQPSALVVLGGVYDPRSPAYVVVVATAGTYVGFVGSRRYPTTLMALLVAAVTGPALLGRFALRSAVTAPTHEYIL